jgi:hypothetical protein
LDRHLVPLSSLPLLALLLWGAGSFAPTVGEWVGGLATLEDSHDDFWELVTEALACEVGPSDVTQAASPEAAARPSRVRSSLWVGLAALQPVRPSDKPHRLGPPLTSAS